jgi:acyl-CoA reductase-like NAD-dependent aldehyde dehydrogenase
MAEILQPWIGGAFASGYWATSDYFSPIDGSRLWSAVESDGEVAGLAVSAAREAFHRNRGASTASRVAWLTKAAAEIERNRETIARSIVAAVGKPMKAALFELSRSVSLVAECAHEIAAMRGETLPLDASEAGKGRYGLTRRVPLGVVLCVTPFNAPSNLLLQKVAPAIAAGNAVIVKPAPEGLQAAILIGQAFAVAGLPSGLLNIVPGGGEAATALAAHPGVDAVSLTGGNRAAEALVRAAGPKRFVAELGSNSAAIVCADADVVLAADRLAVSAFEASGQQCISAQRIFVDASVFDRFVALFIAAAAKLKVGDPFDKSTDIGPMVNARGADRIEAMLEDARHGGAVVALSGSRAGDTLGPTILTHVRTSCRVMTEEAFGPVAIVNPFSDLSEAVQAANATPYGLQASCFTRDLGVVYRIYEELDVGSIWINEGTRFRLDNYPFGGTKASGFGREGVRYAIEEMSQWKFLGISLPANTSPEAAKIVC